MLSGLESCVKRYAEEDSRRGVSLDAGEGAIWRARRTETSCVFGGIVDLYAS